MWLRAIIFGIELVGFIILSIFAIIKFYKNNVAAGYSKCDVIKNLEFDLIYFLVNFAIILTLFLFTFPSYVFLSYNKLILVSVIELFSVLIILFVLRDKENFMQAVLGTFILVMFLQLL